MNILGQVSIDAIGKGSGKALGWSSDKLSRRYSGKTIG
jgi:hypothetical protein